MAHPSRRFGSYGGGVLFPINRGALFHTLKNRPTVAMRPVLRSGRTWLVHPANGRVAKSGADKQLVEALKRAHRWLGEYRCVPTAKLEVLRTAASLDSSYTRKAMQRARHPARHPGGSATGRPQPAANPRAWRATLLA